MKKKMTTVREQNMVRNLAGNWWMAPVGESGKIEPLLCSRTVARFFGVPREARQIKVRISPRKHKGSMRFTLSLSQWRRHGQLNKNTFNRRASEYLSHKMPCVFTPGIWVDAHVSVTWK